MRQEGRVNPWKRKEVIGGATLYLGDCLEILPVLPKVDAVITDPPYGINHARDRNSQKDGWVDYPDNGWDKERPSRAHFEAMLQVSKDQIIWGGNYFTDYLPPTMQWLVWDKGQREFSLADCEFAWSSQQKAARIFNYSRGSALQEGKQHPTQKPVPVMSWCLSFVPKSKSVMDPFMGSGSTGVASNLAAKDFVGIEIAPTFFDIACERIENAQRQIRMFA
jgi:DNA modification methylase